MQVDREGSISRRGAIAAIPFGLAAIGLAAYGCRAEISSPLSALELYPDLQSAFPYQKVAMKFFTLNQQLGNHFVIINNSLLEAQSREFQFPLGSSSTLLISLLPDYSFNNSSIEAERYIDIRRPSTGATEVRVANGSFLEDAKDIKKKNPDSQQDEVYLSLMLSANITRGLLDSLLLKGEIDLPDFQDKYLRYYNSANDGIKKPSEAYFALMKKFYPLHDRELA